jgi:predicted ABC-type ATPase
MAAPLTAADLLALLKPKKGRGLAPEFGDAPYDYDLLAAATVGVPTRPRKPVLLILCGPPGCGKSSAKRALVHDLHIGAHISIDTDAVRTKLMSDPIGLKFPHLDSRKGLATMTGVTNNYNSRLFGHALDNGHNIVFDTTGRNRYAMSSLLAGAKSAGYTIALAIIYAPEDICVARVQSRNVHPDNADRLPLPIPLARSMYQEFQKPGGTASLYIPDPPQEVDDLYLYDNSAQSNPPPPPLLLFHGRDGVAMGPITPFIGFYNTDIRDDAPHLVLTEGHRGGTRRATRKSKRKGKAGSAGWSRRRSRGSRRTRRTR